MKNHPFYNQMYDRIKNPLKKENINRKFTVGFSQ